MKIGMIFLLALVAVVTGCSKNDNNGTCPYQSTSVSVPDSEISAIKNYLDVKGYAAVQDTAGFFYSIEDSGSSIHATSLCTTVSTSYVGRLINDTIFDQTTTGTQAVFSLYQVITGWQKSLPLIGKGGKIIIYLPPALGYGYTNQYKRDSNGNAVKDSATNEPIVVIPKGSILIFEIELKDLAY